MNFNTFNALGTRPYGIHKRTTRIRYSTQSYHLCHREQSACLLIKT